MGIACCCPWFRNRLTDGENKFKVTNVDDDGKTRCPGIMHLSDTDLVFQLKGGGFVKWPYFSLVQYGYDSNVFSFISGTRCATGEGIFAFRCHRAEELFDMLQNSMQRNRISVIPNTEYDSTESESPHASSLSSARLADRSGRYPSSVNTASPVRPEPIGAENLSTSSSAVTTLSQGQRREDEVSNMLLKSSCTNDGIGTAKEHIILDNRYLPQKCPRQAGLPRTQTDRGDLGTLECKTTERDSSCTFWDTGYDSDERRDVSCLQNMGYENLPAMRLRRKGVVSISSSDSQNYSIAQRQSDLISDESLPSSPSIFEEKHNAVQNPSSLANCCSNPRHDPIKSNSFGHECLKSRASAPVYFNFDIRQPDIQSWQLNYIQVEIETGCDSDNPQTPQSPPLPSPTDPVYSEVDLEKTAALSRIRKCVPWDNGTRKTRHSHLAM